MQQNFKAHNKNIDELNQDTDHKFEQIMELLREQKLQFEETPAMKIQGQYLEKGLLSNSKEQEPGEFLLTSSQLDSCVVSLPYDTMIMEIPMDSWLKTRIILLSFLQRMKLVGLI